MLKSIRWRFTFIYFVLVFVAMIIAGVFITQRFEEYYLNDADRQLDAIAHIIIPQIEDYNDFEARGEAIQSTLTNYNEVGLRQEMFVVDAGSKRIVATSTENINSMAVDVLDIRLLTEGHTKVEMGRIIESTSDTIGRTYDKVYPIVTDDELIGLLYLRYDMKDIYETLTQSRFYILQATMISAAITVVMGFFMARSITDPINEVTMKASKMAQGDFNQVVDVRSNDEIGNLGEMFNYLTDQLRTSISETSREKSKMEAIINYMADGLVAVDIDGNIIHSNPVARELLNIDLSHTGRFYGLNETLNIKRILAQTSSWHGSEKISIGDSVLKVNYAPFENDASEVFGIVFVLQDITEQQRLERMRREFVANVSHELKTPLTSIKSYTETILDGVVEDKETVHEFLNVVNTEADRMSRLVRDLLQLSNFDSNMIRLTKEEHNYNEMIRTIIRKLDISIKNKNHVVRFVSEDEEIIGQYDYDRIEQVLINIISNAIKYTPDNGRINIYTMIDKGNVIMKVEDNGMGIPSEDLNRIYERFYRVDKARSRELGGTGLGLSIAKEIVEMHEGEIDITSAVNTGTTVVIRIPKNVE